MCRTTDTLARGPAIYAKLKSNCRQVVIDKKQEHNGSSEQATESSSAENGREKKTRNPFNKFALRLDADAGKAILQRNNSKYSFSFEKCNFHVSDRTQQADSANSSKSHNYLLDVLVHASLPCPEDEYAFANQVQNPM